MFSLQKSLASRRVMALIVALASGVSASPAFAEPARRFVGVLEYQHELRSRADAYQGVHYFLKLDNGKRLNLWATTSVPPNDLGRFTDTRVQVDVSFIPARRPGSNETAPIDHNGHVVWRSERWAVNAVRTVATTFVGMLEYKHQLNREEAYHGVHYFLRLDDGKRLNLWATNQVPPSTLKPFNDKRVQIEATYIPRQKPGPDEAAPVDPNGNVVWRSERWALQAVKPLGRVRPAKEPQAAATAVSAKTLVGKLEYRPLPVGRSDRAYHGVVFFLTQNNGEVQNLETTNWVSESALKSFHGRRVQVQATWSAPSMPHPSEAAPTDPFGKPMPRAGRWAVEQVKVTQ